MSTPDVVRSAPRALRPLGSAGLLVPRLGPRRDDVVRSTKLGYGVPGVADWTAEVIPAGVEQARQRLATDVIDLVFLHSCPRGVLENRALLDALGVL